MYILIILLKTIPFCWALCTDNTKCFENICLEDGYCRDIRPKREVGEPIIVDMKYEIDNVISVDTELNVVGIQISLTQTWMENRVNVSKNVEKLAAVADQIRKSQEHW